MGFVANESVDHLDYDFTDYVAERGEDGEPIREDGEIVWVKGTVPEPSEDQIHEFRQFLSNGVRKVLDEAQGKDNRETRRGNSVRTKPPAKKATARRAEEPELPPILEQAARIAEQLGKDDRALQREALEALAALCSNQPTYEQLARLPYRIQRAFYGYVSGAFLNPEGLLPVSTL